MITTIIFPSLSKEGAGAPLTLPFSSMSRYHRDQPATAANKKRVRVSVRLLADLADVIEDGVARRRLIGHANGAEPVEQLAKLLAVHHELYAIGIP